MTASALRKSLLIGLTTWGSRAAGILSRLVAIPLLLDYLSVDSYAIFALILSLESWCLLFELGLGPSVQTFLSEARGRKEQHDDLIRAASLICLFLVAASFLFLLFFHRPLQAWLTLQSLAWINKEPYLLLTASLCYLAGIFGSLGTRFLYASHRGSLANILQIASHCLALGFIFYAIHVYRGPSPVSAVLLATLSPQALLGIAAFLLFFVPKDLFHLHLIPSWSTIQKVLKRALRFWLLHLLSVLTLNVDYLIMMRTLSSQEIASYNILSRLFALILFLYNAFLLALSPHFTEMAVRKESRELRLTLKKALLMGSAFSLLASLSLIPFKPLLSAFFKTSALTFSLSAFLFFTLYILIRVWTDTYSTALQGLSVLVPFFFLVPVQALLSLGGQAVFSSLFGLSGIVMGLIFSFLLTVVWGLPVAFYALIDDRLVHCGPKAKIFVKVLERWYQYSGRKKVAAREENPPQKILLSCWGSLGDVIIATSFLKQIKDAYPQAKIIFLTSHHSKAVLEDHPFIDTLYLLDSWKDRRISQTPFKRLFRYLKESRRTIRAMRQEKIDAAYELNPFFPNCIPLFWKAGIPSRIGYESGGFGRLLTKGFAWKDDQSYLAQRYKPFLGLDEEKELRPFFDENLSSAAHLPLPLIAKGYAVLHVGAADPRKQWPSDRWHRLCQELASDGWHLVFTGKGRQEREMIEKIRGGCEASLNLADELSWKQFVAVIAHAKLLISVDTAAVHLAGTYEVPSIILFLHTPSHALWMPPHRNCRALIEKLEEKVYPQDILKTIEMLEFTS